MYQIKAPLFYTDLGLQKTVLNPLANGKIQKLFNAFECFFKYSSRQILFSRTFQDSPVYSSAFQACVNLGYHDIKTTSNDVTRLTCTKIIVSHSVIKDGFLVYVELRK